MKNLIQIQNDLKAPKSQVNKFGGYNYRSCEDILEAVKPIAAKYNSLITLNDEIVCVESRYYVKATATFTDGETTVQAHGWAREAEQKKGMDESQITGAASSYARKYALGALLMIDDTKDADSTNTHGKEEPQKPAPTPTPVKKTAQKPSVVDSIMEEALNKISAADTVDKLMEIYNEYFDLQGDDTFMGALSNRRVEVQNAEKLQ